MTLAQIRAALCDIMLPGVENAERWIVPNQGNWWNPQDQYTGTDRPYTWCAFRLSQVRPVVMPDMLDVDGESNSRAFYTGVLEMQLVGAESETMAKSVAHWMNRADVHQLFDDMDAQLYADGCGEYIVTPFYQEGKSTVLAFTARVRLQWAEMIETVQTQLETATWTGGAE